MSAPAVSTHHASMSTPKTQDDLDFIRSVADHPGTKKTLAGRVAAAALRVAGEAGTAKAG